MLVIGATPWVQVYGAPFREQRWVPRRGAWLFAWLPAWYWLWCALHRREERAVWP